MHSFLISVFFITALPSSVPDRRIEQLLPQSLNLPLKYVRPCVFLFLSLYMFIHMLVSIPTRTFVCIANHLYILYSLGKHLAVFFLACNGRVCAAKPGLIAEKGEPQKTSSIYTTDTWSRRWEKLNTRGAIQRII